MQRIPIYRSVGQVITFFVLPLMSLAQPRIEYSLGMSKLHTHLLEVEIGISPIAAEREVEFSMPAWHTGRYVVFDFAWGVCEFSAVDGDKKALVCEKKNKRTGTIPNGGSATVKARYLVYANEFNERLERSVRQNCRKPFSVLGWEQHGNRDRR